MLVLRTLTPAILDGSTLTTWPLPPARLAPAHAHVVTHPSDYRRLSESDDALAVGIGLVVEPGEDPRAPVADAAADAEAARAGAEVAPVAQGREGDADNDGDFLHGQQFIVGVQGVGQSGPFGCCSWRSSWRVAGRGREIRLVRSFSIRTVARSLWSIVRRRHHRLHTSSGGTPFGGYVVIGQIRSILPKVVRTLLAEPSLTEMS
jgi:hypothetical protein